MRARVCLSVCLPFVLSVRLSELKQRREGEGRMGKEGGGGGGGGRLTTTHETEKNTMAQTDGGLLPCTIKRKTEARCW